MPKIKTGSWATEKPERRHLTPPCNHVCPAGNDVRGFVEAVGQNDYDLALSVLLEVLAITGGMRPGLSRALYGYLQPRRI